MKRIYNNIKNKVKEKTPRLYNQIDKKKKYIKYLISGGTAAFTQLSLLFIFTEVLKIWYIFSTSIAFVFAFFVSFYLQKFWTFRDNNREKQHRQMLVYFMVGVINMFVNAGGMYVLVDAFDIWFMLAQILMSLLIAVSSFMIYNFIIFNKEEAKEKSILIATGIYSPDIGGPATYVKILCEYLPKHGFKLEVITYSDKVDSNDNKIFRISRSQNILLRYFKYFWKVFKLIPEFKSIYVMGPVSEGLPTWLACKLRRRNYILKIVGDYAWEQGRQRFGVKELLNDFQNKKYGFKVELMRKIQRMVARKAGKIIVPSNYLKNIVKKWGVSENKIKVIYNSVEEMEIDEVEKEKINISGDIILSSGRLVPWKGFNILIDIMPDLLRENPNFKLIIAGDGPDSEKLKVESKKLGLEENVKLLGNVDQNILWKYMQIADMFVLNTGYEGLSHVLIEAMMLEVPIIATNVGGNSELIENNISGLLVEFNNKAQIKEAILKLYKDKELSARLVNKAKRKYQNNFYREKMIQGLIEVL